MKKTFVLLLSVLCGIANVSAQHYTFYDYEDSRQRGYYDRPYLRYEAEPDWCSIGNKFSENSSVEFLTRTDDQRYVQSEASNQQAAQLNNRGDYVEWIKSNNSNDNGTKRDGLTIRYSVPDGSTSKIGLYINGIWKADITLDTDHSWQYCKASNTGNEGDSPEKYSISGSNASERPIVRMRFDEVHYRYDEKIPDGATIRLVYLDGGVPITIDFMELEPVPEPYTLTDADKFWENYDLDPWDSQDVFRDSTKDRNLTAIEVNPGDGSDLKDKIQNAGENTVIYIPAGDYYVDGRITQDNEYVKVIGAGMWYTNIYFTNSGGVGFYSDFSKCMYKGFYMASNVNIQRYNGEYGGSSPGKGFQGCYGTFTEFHDLWVEYFECGMWLANYGNSDGGWQANHLKINNCRFRNNYADGINLCRGSHDCIVEHCSFRNNGDDDMASWSADGLKCFRNTYRYCTAEHNWRASSLGFFGGEGNKAHNILIVDGLEAGARIVSDFPGVAYTGNPAATFSDISIYHCGCIEGSEGVSGDFWGHRQGALHIHGSKNYTVANFKASDINIYNSRGHAVMVRRQNQPIEGLLLSDFTIDGTGVNYGIDFSETTDKSGFNGIHVCGTTADNNPSDGSDGSSNNALTGELKVSNIFSVEATRSTEAGTSGVAVHDPIKYLGSNYEVNDIPTGIESLISPDDNQINLHVENGTLVIEDCVGDLSVFNVSGHCVFSQNVQGQTCIEGLAEGVYVVKSGTKRIAKVII